MQRRQRLGHGPRMQHVEVERFRVGGPAGHGLRVERRPLLGVQHCDAAVGAAGQGAAGSCGELQGAASGPVPN